MGDGHHLYMQLALREAEQALREREVPVGAVLVAEGGEVLAGAHNRSLALQDPTAHAEILVLRLAAERLGTYRLVGTTLYVTVEPCVMCAGALVWARVASLIYGVRDRKGGAVDSLYQVPRDARLNHTLDVVSGVMERECREIMQSFFRQLRAGEHPGTTGGIRRKKSGAGEVPKRS